MLDAHPKLDAVSVWPNTASTGHQLRDLVDRGPGAGRIPGFVARRPPGCSSWTTCTSAPVLRGLPGTIAVLVKEVRAPVEGFDGAKVT